MRRIARATILAAFVAGGALLPLGTAALAASGGNSSATVTTASEASAVSVLASGRISCATYDECYQRRSNYARYYAVSDIYWIPPDATCPGGCSFGPYYFDYRER
jgi:hypothetical protein